MAWIKLAGGAADPLRITGGSGDAADDLAAELLFSANYPALRVDKLSIPFSAPGADGTVSTVDYGHPPFTFALAILDDGTPLYPYFFEFAYFVSGGWFYDREYVLWQVTPTFTRYWIGGMLQGGTLHIWNILP